MSTNLNAWFIRWFYSTNHKDIGTLYYLILSGYVVLFILTFVISVFLTAVSLLAAYQLNNWEFTVLIGLVTPVFVEFCNLVQFLLDGCFSYYDYSVLDVDLDHVVTCGATMTKLAATQTNHVSKTLGKQVGASPEVQKILDKAVEEVVPSAAAAVSEVSRRVLASETAKGVLLKCVKNVRGPVDKWVDDKIFHARAHNQMLKVRNQVINDKVAILDKEVLQPAAAQELETFRLKVSKGAVKAEVSELSTTPPHLAQVPFANNRMSTTGDTLNNKPSTAVKVALDDVE